MIPLEEWFIDPLRFQFMERALLAALMVGAISGVIGTFVVVRGMSFFGDALSHSILPGVAVAYLYGRNLFIGGLIAGIGTAIVVGWLTREKRLKEDTAIGVVFAGMFALGIALISSQQSYTVDLTHILFGNILGVNDADLRTMAICGAIVLGTTLLFYKEFLVTSFDPGLATTLKLPSEGLRLLMLVLIAITIVASLRIVGTTLMLALLVTPAATAQLLVKRLHYMMLLSAGLGMLSGALGIFISYHQEVATGPAIVLTATGFFIVVFAGVQSRQRWASWRQSH
jgi:ABC-type Mn2+/Zn2+ transport system permease subunit